MDSLNLGFSIIGSNKSSKQVQRSTIDRPFIRGRIEGLDAPDVVKEELIRMLFNYPDGALQTFWNNLPGVVETLKVKRNKNEL